MQVSRHVREIKRSNELTDLLLQMATVEVNLKEGDALPEQHLDEGENIERIIVPLSELYHKLKGTPFPFRCLDSSRTHNDGCHFQRCQKRRAQWSMQGKKFSHHLRRLFCELILPA